AHSGAHTRLAALRRARPLGEARVARHLPGTEADLVPVAARRARLRHQPARERPSGIRRLALARLLGAAGSGHRLQARGVSARPRAALGLPRDGAARVRPFALWPPPQASAWTACGTACEAADRGRGVLEAAHLA